MQVNTSNLNKREFKRIGSRNMAKVCRLKKVVEEKIEVNSGKNNIHFYGNIRESTNSCYTAKDNVDERRYLANDSIPELQPGRNVN
ncbi:7576_t:CDS:2 [Rhizophagus irregularis]|nr:7576_t:CDS:2 [Rhizophagus irregularis]